MSIASAIQLSLSGLRATQAGLDIVSQNVANAGTVGYTRRTLATEALVAGGRTVGVDVKGASRTLDTLVQRQLRLEQAGAAYASTRASVHTTLDRVFDRPGGVGSLPTLLSTFTGKLAALANNPSSSVSQSEILAAASDLAGSLNALSDQVQAMRQDTEDAIGAAVSKADGLLKRIADLNGRIVGHNTAALQDQRDALVDQLSTLIDVKATISATGAVSLSTTGGLTLVNGTVATGLGFEAHNIGPASRYDSDPALRGVGTITATDATGAKRDVIASGLIRSGEIAAHLDIRDTVLVQAQTQLDELAAGLASALSDKTIAGTAATSGAQSGFDLDLGALQAGNRITVSVTDPGGATRNLVFARTDSAAATAAAGEAGLIGIDFSGGFASVASQIQTALGGAYTVSNPSGSTIRLLNNGATSSVDAASATATVSGLSTGDPELPLFVDGPTGALYTGSFEGSSQLAGLAGRIAVNQAVKNAPSALTSYGPSVPAGDATRPLLLFDRLTKTERSFAGAAGIGGSASPWSGSVVGFASAVIATQASEANSAANLDAGQQVVLNAIQGRYAEQAGVDIDTELTQLIQLQTAYGANARLLTAAREMMDTLLRIAG
ncbi:flagellar hook-associated protein FlgK [Enterovirga rhinocerotis]|uniref:Flagellar hook-associated protein 1 n=1 Tax=Enterovirga rhinocerotis TaxID=1339210 RepID=A0A4R7BKU2_9HYPH|nr:flagellar hook-associated protein FlgK [Enterovirga rhinocerotis]TDR85212.1 flagellar hook-associated protein 1 FlgK [Enterovirga rhinocerotis]